MRATSVNHDVNISFCTLRNIFDRLWARVAKVPDDRTSVSRFLPAISPSGFPRNGIYLVYTWYIPGIDQPRRYRRYIPGIYQVYTW